MYPNITTLKRVVIGLDVSPVAHNVVSNSVNAAFAAHAVDCSNIQNFGVSASLLSSLTSNNNQYLIHLDSRIDTQSGMW